MPRRGLCLLYLAVDQILADFGYLGGFSAAGGDLLIYRPF
jgi:hypothetical protein